MTGLPVQPIGAWACPGSRLVLKAGAEHTTAWYLARAEGIGGSDIAALLGESPYDDATPWFVWRSKQVPLDGAESNRAQTRGTVLEPIVRDLACERLGVRTRRAGIHRSRLSDAQDPDAPVQRAPYLASVDYLTGDGGGLECKTTTSFTVRSWAAEFGDGEPPQHYVDQCEWYCMVTGRPFWWLAILVIDTWELIVWRIEPNAEHVELMQVVADEFWWTYVETGVEPEPSLSLAEVKARYPSDDGSVVNYSEGAIAVELEELLSERRMLSGRMKDDKARRDEIDAQLKARAGGAAEVQLYGSKAFTNKASVSRRVDTTRLREEMPDVAAQFTKTSESRTLRLAAGWQ